MPGIVTTEYELLRDDIGKLQCNAHLEKITRLEEKYKDIKSDTEEIKTDVKEIKESLTNGLKTKVDNHEKWIEERKKGKKEWKTWVMGIIAGIILIILSMGIAKVDSKIDRIINEQTKIQIEKGR